MSLLQIAIIALVQGITEWLPISSSGHVLLTADLFGLEGRDEYLINAMAHVGTLGAVLLYFYKDIYRACLGGFELIALPIRRRPLSDGARLAAHILASLPIALVAILIYQVYLPETAKDALRGTWTVALTTIVFALFLWWADVVGSRSRTVTSLKYGHSILIGASQAIAAILPGTSRSGITMTVARAFGYERTEAARFSMLIGAPILAAAGGYAFWELAGSEEVGIATLNDGLMVAALSFVSGYASIFLLMALLKRMSFLPFVLYRLVLGVVLILATPTVGLLPLL